MGFNQQQWEYHGDLMVIQWDLPSGKHTENYGKIHHF